MSKNIRTEANVKTIDVYRSTVQPKSGYIQYKLAMYKYYREFMEEDIEKMNREKKRSRGEFYNIFDEKTEVEYSNYDEFIEKNSARYRFLDRVKLCLRSTYETRIENMYKKLYSPSNVAKLLDEGHDIDDAFKILDEQMPDMNF
jgi:hypothetical protein